MIAFAGDDVIMNFGIISCDFVRYVSKDRLKLGLLFLHVGILTIILMKCTKKYILVKGMCREVQKLIILICLVCLPYSVMAPWGE